jgi:hypothetical protein
VPRCRCGFGIRWIGVSGSVELETRVAGWPRLASRAGLTRDVAHAAQVSAGSAMTRATGTFRSPMKRPLRRVCFGGRGLKSGREALAGIAADEDGGELLPGCGSDHTYWSSGSPMGFRWCCGSLLGRSETLQTRVTRCSTRASSGRSSSWGTSERSYSVIITGTDSCLGANGSSSRLSGLIPRHAGIRLGTPGLSDLVLRARFDSIARMR